MSKKLPPQKVSILSEEQRLLASIDASIQDQDVYEDQVIREATYQLAPQLTGTGFPDLRSIAPSYCPQHPYNPSDLTHFYTILTKTRRELQKSPNNDLLNMKEQILLGFLNTVAMVEDLPVREELRTDRTRAKQIQTPNTTTKQGYGTADNILSKVNESQGPIVKRKRVSMVKRKREEVTGIETDDELLARKETLKRLRDEREKRKEQRRTAYEQEASTEEEAEFDSEMVTEGPVLTGWHEDEEKQEVSDTTVVLCPVCQGSVQVRHASQADVALSVHIDECQRRRPTRRSRVQSLPKQTSLEDSLNQTEQPSSSKRSEKKKHPPMLMRPAPRRLQDIDDFHEHAYEDRVDDWIENGLSRMKEMPERDREEALPGEEQLEDGFIIPAWVNNHLFGYQRECLRWMWTLHLQKVGKLLGDAMGLGKTVQVSAFLGCAAASRKLKSVLIIAPATMLQFWLTELSIWAPGLRRILIHPSGEGDGVSRGISSHLLKSLSKWLEKQRHERVNEHIDQEDRENMEPHYFCGTGYVVITTYENVRRNANEYINHPWSYVVLDEAQKIRNPDAEITLTCKRLRTPHRIAMTGTPIQNDLRELWCLFDFVFPGRLGTLPSFEQEFADPIKRGGYINASPMQVQLAYRCAVLLKDLIQPYLLRREKKDVKEVKRMPNKTEHVLFCSLTSQQREMYEAYLQSDEIARVLRGTNQLFSAITMLRKICNHPDLVCSPDRSSMLNFIRNRGPSTTIESHYDSDEASYLDIDDPDGCDLSMIQRSAKLCVLEKLLSLWHEQGRRVLIFTQWRKMLDIIQLLMVMKGWTFGRLDGNTNVGSRQRLVDHFNSDDSYFAMLCTTRTGGVGLNLTGADTVVIFDPDWNPSTDAQARERAWRFGQKRPVSIYRLVTAGTVEEKMYHRQIFKTALSNKVLQDPRQKRLFSQRDLRDLFSLKTEVASLSSGGDGITETSQITRGEGVVNNESLDGEVRSEANEETLKAVMNNKGLAGIFDHQFVERDPSRKSVTAREMENEAKKVAREALKSLQESVTRQKPFEPTWTGSLETQPRQFGVSSGNSGLSSSRLLASIRQRNASINSQGLIDERSDETMQDYTKLAHRIKQFVQRRKPTTDQLLQEFEDVANSDVAIFRRLLKSVAFVQNRRWVLKA